MKTIALLVAAAACLAVALNFTTGLNTLLDVTSIVFTAVPILASFVAVGFKRQGILVVADIALQVAIIGMLIGSVGLLQNMSDPKAVGPAFALTLSVVFYGLLIAGICSQLSSNISEPIAAPLAWQRVVSVLFWTGIVLYTMENAAGLAAFLDLVSFLIVASLTLAIIGTSASEKLKSLARYLPVAGFIGVLVGVIGMLQNMSNPKAIGPAMAIALLTLTYCNLISVTLKLAFPETILRERANYFTYLGFVLFFIMGIYSVLILSFI